MMRFFGLLAGCLAFMVVVGCDSAANPVPQTPKLVIQDVTGFEGNAQTAPVFRFKVYLQPAQNQAVTVQYRTEDGSATAGNDYTAQQGTLRFEAQQQEQTIEVPVLGDSYKEPEESFKVILSAATGATIETGTSIGTIRNDDTELPNDSEGYLTPEYYAGYQMVWQDEFSGTTLDETSWNREEGGSGWGNAELQHYTKRTDNAYLANGKLVIEAKKENYGGNAYTSARITTAGKREFAFGRVDIRAKLPKGQGIWPALWMLGYDISTIGWPASGEIDIMELLGHEPAKVYGTAHWGNQGDGVSQHITNATTLSQGDFSQQYHVFSLVWQQNRMTWYVDDVAYATITNAQVSGNYPFNKAYFFIMNVAVGGNWPGAPNASTVFPQQMQVDYIRVFQTK